MAIKAGDDVAGAIMKIHDSLTGMDFVPKPEGNETYSHFICIVSGPQWDDPFSINKINEFRNEEYYEYDKY